MDRKNEYIEYMCHLWNIHKSAEITMALRGDNNPIPMRERVPVYIIRGSDGEYLFRFRTSVLYCKTPKENMTLRELEQAIIRDAPNIKSIVFISEESVPIII